MRRGDVVAVDWPFSDMTGSKVRPAVIVQADFLNGLIDDTILVQITSTRHDIPGTEVEIDPAVETASGLEAGIIGGDVGVRWQFAPSPCGEEMMAPVPIKQTP